MCGIAGICDAEGLSPRDRRMLPDMVSVLHHRGPDDSGLYHDDHCALGHARLSIIDLDGGRQPMCNENGAVWVVFNGEIYNFTALRDRLIGLGHRFRTRSDTEVLVHLYEQEGPDMLAHLEGMFALAVWDTHRRRLLLARDRLGIKPLYVWSQGGRLAFGSELKAVLCAGVPRRIRPDALLDYLCYLYVPSPKSIFEGIEKIEPGWGAVWQDGALRRFQYWDVPTECSHEGDPDELTARLGTLVRNAVQQRLVADVPLGAFLSGGLDSSTVVANMTELAARPPVTCSVGFDVEAFNELDAARVVARRFAADHHEHVVRPDAVAVAQKLAWHYDEPFADPSAVPTYYVSQAAREHVKVALSGDGGDENFGGYRRYRFAAAEQRIRAHIPQWLRWATFGPAGLVYPKADWLPQVLRAQSTLRNLAVDPDRAFFQSVVQLAPGAARRLLSDDLRSALTDYDPFSVLQRHFDRCQATHVAARCMYVDLKTYLPDDILCKVDRASMACSLEVRVPLLAHQIVEFAAAVPWSLKMQRGSGKWLFKQLMRPTLGPEVVDRPKQGFCMPVGQWLRGPLRSMAGDLLLGGGGATDEWLNRRRIEALWRQHQTGRRNCESTLWALLMLELWAGQLLRGDDARGTASEDERVELIRGAQSCGSQA